MSFCMPFIWISQVLLAFLPTLALAGPQGRVSLSEAGFVSEDYKQTDRKQFQFVGVGVDTLAKTKKESEVEDTLQAQVHGVISPGVSVLSYINVSQLYWKQSPLAVGRKKLNWNQLDEDFDLGLYQPLFKWNALEPVSQGLTGVFLNLENQDGGPRWGVTLFGSPLFIPDQGPGYEIKGGQFERSNPYFQAVPSRAMINGQMVNVNYNVQKPETQDVVFNRSFAGRIFVGSETDGGFAQGSFANKPSNQLALGFDGYVFSNGVEDVTKIDILPTVSYHTLTSVDLKYSTRHFEIGASGIQESPEDPTFKGDWTYTTFDRSTLFSGFVGTKFYGFDMKMAYLTVNGGESVASGKFANQSDKFLPQRYPFRNAGLATLNYNYRIKKFQNLSLSTRYLQGERSEFALWTSHLNYQWEERWSMYAQSQLVAVQDNQDGRKTAFWPYVNNDSMAAGVVYVF